MKIEPMDRSAQLSNQAVDKQKRDQSSGGFDSVLRDTIKSSKLSASSMGQPIKPLVGNGPLTGIQPDSGRTETSLAARLLDDLDRYQKMLADPKITLKMLQPAVDRMSLQAANSETFLNRLPDGHPLKMIVQEAMLNIDKEIERFNSGYYVDR